MSTNPRRRSSPPWGRATRRVAAGIGRVLTTVTAAMIALAFWPRVAPAVGMESGGSRADLTRVLVLGDSLTWQSQTQIEDRLLAYETSGDAVVATRAVPGSGLASPGFFDWETEAARLAREFGPDVVVIEFAGNCDPHAPERCGTPEYFREWRKGTRAVTTAFTAVGADVVWVTPPPMAFPDWNARATMIDGLLREMAGRGEVRIADARSSLSIDGRFAAQMPTMDGQWVTVRDADGVHLSLSGRDRFADAIVHAIEPLI